MAEVFFEIDIENKCIMEKELYKGQPTEKYRELADIFMARLLFRMV